MLITLKTIKHHLLSSLGWAKCFGHPHIIPELGIEQLLNTQHDKYEVILEFINIAYQFKMFVTSYYLKYHTWPKVEHPNILPESLCSYYNTNTWPTSYGYKRIALEDWDQYPVEKLVYKTDFSLAEII